MMKPGSHACQLDLQAHTFDHPWSSKALPARPTRLIAVPPAAPRDPAPMTLGTMLRRVRQRTAGACHGLQELLESLWFGALLTTLLSSLWALSALQGRG